MPRPLRAKHPHPWVRRFGPCERPAGSGTGLPAPLRHRGLHLTLIDDQRTEEVEEPRHLKAWSPHGQGPDDPVTSTANATLPSRACRRRLHRQLFALIHIRPPPVLAVKIFTPRPTRPAQVYPPPVITVKAYAARPTRPRSPAPTGAPALPPQVIQVGQPADLIALILPDAARQVSQ
jgi:hypothetical protein